MKALALLILLLAIQVRAESLPSALVRPLSGSERAVPVTRVAFDGTYVEGLLYSDVQTDSSQLREILKYFDEKVYPRMTEELTPDPLSAVRKNQKIVLLFDSLKGKYPAYHSHRLAEYHRDFILIDVDSVLDSNFAAYYLPHELQHVFRFHRSPGEADWLNEGLSKFAESYMNRQEFPVGSLDGFSRTIGISLFYDYSTPNPQGYFNDMFFIYYLYKHFGGIDLIRKIMLSPLSGVAAVNSALASMRAQETVASLKPFYTFEKAFTNYELALLLNAYASTLESGGLWDLKMTEDVVSENQNFQVSAEPLPTNKLLTLNPMSSRYFEMTRKCVNVTAAATVVPMLIDLDSSTPVRVLKSGQSVCLNELKQQGQFLVLMNLQARAEAAVR